MEAGLLTRPRTAAPVLSARTRAGACLAALVGVAAVLRLWAFASVPPNPFYDAAVRSMSQSWHNFFYGAVEPSGQVSIDKIPVDLWVQVASVKLFGYSSVATRLPEAVAGVLAVPLLYDLVRRLFGRTAGLAAAAALAVLPVAVLTARSDTMDSLMMLLDVFAAWLVVRGAQSGKTWPFVAAGAVLGLAFNVKLFEALIVVPAIGLLALLAGDIPAGRRARAIAGGFVAFTGVSFAWLTAAGMAPLGSRPWPIGSTNGSVWNVVFAFNGTDRLNGTASARALAIDPPGALRFFADHGHAYASIVGSTLLAALVFGGLAAIVATVLRRSEPSSRLDRVGALFFAVWLIIGVGVLSYMQRFLPRYLDAATPAIAAVLGSGIGWLAARAERRRAAALSLGGGAALVALAALALAHPPAWAAVAGLAAAAAAVVFAARGQAAPLAVFATVAALAAPAAAALSIAGSARSDAGLAAPLPAAEVSRLSAYLLPRQGSATYEVASTSVFKADPLIVRDGRPVVFLTSYLGRPLLTPVQLRKLVVERRVKYILSGSGPAPVVRWARKHSVDVSRAAGLPRGTLARFQRLH